MKELLNKTTEERLAICTTCPHFSEVQKAEGKTFIRPDSHCTSCGCSIEPKVRCLSTQCPEGKWGGVVTEDQEKEIKKEIEDAKL